MNSNKERLKAIMVETLSKHTSDMLIDKLKNGFLSQTLTETTIEILGNRPDGNPYSKLPFNPPIKKSKSKKL